MQAHAHTYALQHVNFPLLEVPVSLNPSAHLARQQKFSNAFGVVCGQMLSRQRQRQLALSISPPILFCLQEWHKNPACLRHFVCLCAPYLVSLANPVEPICHDDAANGKEGHAGRTSARDSAGISNSRESARRGAILDNGHVLDGLQGTKRDGADRDEVRSLERVKLW